MIESHLRLHVNAFNLLLKIFPSEADAHENLIRTPFNTKNEVYLFLF